MWLLAPHSSVLLFDFSSHLPATFPYVMTMINVRIILLEDQVQQPNIAVAIRSITLQMVAGL